LKEKNEVHVNEVFAQLKIIGNPYKGNRNNKINNTATQYSCFICGGPNHKISDHSHQQATLEMFKNKKTNFASKKENVVVNMVLVVTTRNQVPKANAFKEKETKQNNTTTN
jgi:hypothetical protein